MLQWSFDRRKKFGIYFFKLYRLAEMEIQQEEEVQNLLFSNCIDLFKWSFNRRKKFRIYCFYIGKRAGLPFLHQAPLSLSSSLSIGGRSLEFIVFKLYRLVQMEIQQDEEVQNLLFLHRQKSRIAIFASSTPVPEFLPGRSIELISRTYNQKIYCSNTMVHCFFTMTDSSIHNG